MWYLPFQIEFNNALFAGSCLWCLALYLAFASFREFVINTLEKWFNFAEGFLYTSKTEFERTRKARESQNAFLASLTSVIPFLIVGIFCNWLVAIGLGENWCISLGLLAVVCCAVYDLGRRDASQ